jgi:hypothetical protein
VGTDVLRIELQRSLELFVGRSVLAHAPERLSKTHTENYVIGIRADLTRQDADQSTGSCGRKVRLLIAIDRIAEPSGGADERENQEEHGEV